MPETAVIYARYSSAAQRDTSIDQQIQVCTQYAARIGVEVVGTYTDRAMTGTNDHRPGFQQMIQDAPRSGWSYVLVYALDRFARDRYDSAINKRKLRDAGVRVLSATEAISPDPSGILMESVLEGMAEYYSAELARKITRGMTDNAQKCKCNGPMPPGYVKGPDGCFEIYEPEAQAIRELYRRVQAGEMVSAILEDWERRGLRKRTGQPWRRACVDKCLTRETYTGVYQFGSVRVEGGVPQIIDPALWQAVQATLANKRNPRKTGVPARRRREQGMYLLTGKLFCGRCKSPMVGLSGRSHTGTSYHYYVCRDHRTAQHCPMPPIRREQIEYAVAAAVRDQVLTDDTIHQLAQAYLDHLSSSGPALDLRQLEAQLADVQKSIKNIMAAIEAGVITPTVTDRLRELEAEQKRIQTHLQTTRSTLTNIPTLADVEDTLYMYRDGNLTDPHYQQSLLDAFLVSAYVYPDHYKLILQLGSTPQEITLPADLPLDDPGPVEGEGSYKLTEGPPNCDIRTIDTSAAHYLLFMVSVSR